MSDFGSEGVGVNIGEFGHILGLPDLYNTAFLQSKTPLPPERDSAGIGAWGLMGWGAAGWNGDDGPNSLSAWSRHFLGWTNVLQPTTPQQTIALPAISPGGHVLELPASTREGFLVEYRTRSGSYYDRNIPAEGVLIWHGGPVASSPAKLPVDLEAADGRWLDAGAPLGVEPDPEGGDNLDFWAHDRDYATRHEGNLGDAGDPFGTGDRFASDTNPSSRLSKGWALHALRVSLSGDTALISVSVPPPAIDVAYIHLLDDNGDRILSPGEHAELKIALVNVGGTQLTGVRVELSSTDPLVSVDVPVVQYEDIPIAGQADTPITDLPAIRVGTFEERERLLSLGVQVFSDQATLDTTFVVKAISSVEIRGRVTDNTGQALPDVQISIAGQTSLSDDDGRFTFTVVPGLYVLRAPSPAAPSFSSVGYMLTIASDMEIPITLQSTVRLFGVVSDASGTPLASV